MAIVIAWLSYRLRALAQAAPADVDRRYRAGTRRSCRWRRRASLREACAIFQRPPEDLAETAYLRNGYEAMRRILAMEKWQETASCACFYDDVTYEQAIAASERFVGPSDPLVPFYCRSDAAGGERAHRAVDAEACGD